MREQIGADIEAELRITQSGYCLSGGDANVRRVVAVGQLDERLLCRRGLFIQNDTANRAPVTDGWMIRLEHLLQLGQIRRVSDGGHFRGGHQLLQRIAVAVTY